MSKSSMQLEVHVVLAGDVQRTRLFDVFAFEASKSKSDDLLVIFLSIA